MFAVYSQHFTFTVFLILKPNTRSNLVTVFAALNVSPTNLKVVANRNVFRAYRNALHLALHSSVCFCERSVRLIRNGDVN